MPAVLYRYIQVLRRPDLVNSKGKPLVTNARLEAVWKRLSERLATVVADTSMITLSTAYATHFHDIYIDGKENAKMTGDRMKMLMLTLPFMVRDLIAPEVHLALYILGILSIKYTSAHISITLVLERGMHSTEVALADLTPYISVEFFFPSGILVFLCYCSVCDFHTGPHTNSK